MTDKNQQNNKSGKHDFFEQFSDKDRKEVEEIWKASIHASPEVPELDENEIEQAWSNVKKRTENQADHSVSQVNITSNSFPTNRKWWAAAAVVLLIAGAAALLLMPNTITAPRGEIISTTLPDGSTVELNSGTELQYNRLFAYTNRTVELNGEAFFSVEKSNEPFIVQTKNAVVKVTGTKFNVRSWSQEPGRETEVVVSEGRVQFYRDDYQIHAVTVTPGQISHLSSAMQKPSAPKTIKTERFLGWRSNKLMFNNKSLDAILNELERRFDLSVSLENSAIGRETLTAYYANPQNAESIIKDICRVKGLRYEATANGYRVYR